MKIGIFISFFLLMNTPVSATEFCEELLVGTDRHEFISYLEKLVDQRVIEHQDLESLRLALQNNQRFDFRENGRTSVSSLAFIHFDRLQKLLEEYRLKDSDFILLWVDRYLNRFEEKEYQKNKKKNLGQNLFHLIN